MLIAFGLVGCVQSHAVPCGDGLVCAAGHECRVIGDRHLCVGGEELDACLMLPEGGACTVGGVAGSCRDGVCIAAICGDHVTDPGEACDDGNATIGDGCSLECLSNETCGNGFTDSLRREGTMLVANEQCDDANLGGHDGCSSGCRIEAPVWLSGSHVKATVGLDPALVWDATRETIVMFGGRLTNVDSSELFEWNGASWTSRVSIDAPPPRSAHAMAYDAGRHRVVVFGGASGTAKLDDTWAWDGVSWRLLGGAMAPAPRDGVRMAYDAKRKKVVLFGGAAAASVSGGATGLGLGDTWELDGDTWTRVCATCGPVPRYGQAMAFDPARGVIVMFGGFDSTGMTLADVWEYDGTWHDKTPAATGSGPFGRGYSGMVYDTVRKRIVIAGGNYQNVPLTDAWAWNGTAWSALPSLPVGYDHHGLAFDVARGRTVLVASTPARVLELDATMWRQITMVDPPGGRIDAGIATDPERGMAIMFGGETTQSTLDETWTFDGAHWTPVTGAPRPPARSAHGMAFDRVAHRAVVYGGEAAGGATLGDSWTFDPAMSKWTQQTAGTPRKSNELAWDGQRVISFGGMTSDRTADTLAWTGTGWMTLSPGMAPPARTDAAMAFDPARNRVVLFGGTTGTGNMPPTTVNDTWAWDGTTWARLTTPLAPPARERATLAWDAGRRRLVLFGGRTGTTEYDDAWELDGSTWSPLALQLRPLARYGHLAVGAAQGILVFGGLGESTKSMEQWRLRWEGFGADEACRADRDLDGDGLAGCADPDCWAVCQPLCPPGAAASCVTTTPHCGDGACGGVESCRSCPGDCGACPATCGDSACDGGESATTCPGDC